MQKNTNTLIRIGRVLGILYVAFVTLFALDGLTQGFFGFFMHLIPTFILVATLTMAWKNPIIGGLMFLGFGLIFTLWFSTYKEFISFAIISLPLLLIGLLFLKGSSFSHKLEQMLKK